MGSALGDVGRHVHLVPCCTRDMGVMEHAHAVGDMVGSSRVLRSS